MFEILYGIVQHNRYQTGEIMGEQDIHTHTLHTPTDLHEKRHKDQIHINIESETKYLFVSTRPKKQKI